MKKAIAATKSRKFSSLAEFQRHFYPNSLRNIPEENDAPSAPVNHEGTGLATSFLQGVKEGLTKSKRR